MERETGLARGPMQTPVAVAASLRHLDFPNP